MIYNNKLQYLIKNDYSFNDVVVLIDPVCQLTEPSLPKPVWVAPHAKVTAVPDPPKVKVDPLCLSISFTSTLDND